MAGGFRPVKDISGNSYTGKLQTFFVVSSHATLLAPGDGVRETGDADSTTGIATVDTISATTRITGFISSIDFNVSNLEQKGLPANTSSLIKVQIDPNIIFEAEISNGSIAATDVGKNADVVAAVATQSGGLVSSNMTIDAGTLTTATAQVRIVGLKDGAVGAGVTVFCRINESTIKSTTGV